MKGITLAKRASIAGCLVLILSAFVAGTALAATVNGTAGDNRLVGTNAADKINGYAGADTVFAQAGPDTVQGGTGNDPALKGGVGADRVLGGLGADKAYGDSGNDVIRMTGDTQQDFVNCGEDSSGADIDTAYVSGNDLVDGTRAGAITVTTGFSCERIFMDGVALPQV